MIKKKVFFLLIFVVLLVIGPGLILAKPSWMGEEWNYREKSVNLLDRSAALLTKYLKTVQEYLNGTIDQVALKNYMFDYYSCIIIIDGEAHRLSPFEGYEDFHENLMKGVHSAYDLVFYRSMNESDINAAVGEINYAKISMPNAKVPKPIDLSIFGKTIAFVGIVGIVASISQFSSLSLINVILTLAFGLCNFLDWNAASAITCIPCDWNIFFIATSKAIFLNFSFIVFLITMLISACVIYITSLGKSGTRGFIFMYSIATILFSFANFFDFNSLLQTFLSSTGNMADYSWWFFTIFFVFRVPLSPSGLQYSWKGFVNLSIIAFLTTVGLNFYLWKRKKGIQLR